MTKYARMHGQYYRLVRYSMGVNQCTLTQFIRWTQSNAVFNKLWDQYVISGELKDAPTLDVNYHNALLYPELEYKPRHQVIGIKNAVGKTKYVRTLAREIMARYGIKTKSTPSLP